jgi:hypothetical protein
MSKRLSYTKYEQELLPDFRAKINRAESTEDVKKFFVRTIQELFSKVFEGKMDLRYENVHLDPKNKPFCVFSDVVTESQPFKSAWNNSDLPNVIERLAEPAVRRYNYLEKKPEKTEAKIRM